MLTEDKSNELCQLSLGWYSNLVSLSKVKCLVYCEMCECTYNFVQWKNRVRTMSFGFGFCSVLGGRDRFGSWQTWLLVRFCSCSIRVLPISSKIRYIFIFYRTVAVELHSNVSEDSVFRTKLSRDCCTQTLFD